jgi:hypothetical protein
LPVFVQSDTGKKAPQDTRLQSGYCPQTHDLEAAPKEEHWFEGGIGNNKVRMYLNRGGAGVVGSFYAIDSDWTPTFLGGEWSTDKITLLAESEEQAPKGKLQGQLVNGAFTGSWTPIGSDDVDPVRLALIQKPACDGRGVWKRFDDPKWPVSFSYPASWHIKREDDALLLVCPDPEVMTYNDQVTIYEGKGKPIGVWDLVECANGWMKGGKCSLNDGTPSAFAVSEVSRRPGKTVLNSEDEWRVECAIGGYVGLGNGEDRIVLMRDYWAEFIGAGSSMGIVDRLVKSAHLRAAH